MEKIKNTVFIGVLKAQVFAVSKIFFLIICFVFSIQAKAQLVINEVSQGPTGNKEYVELLVVGTPTCTTIPCMDLRGYYIDDNNGNHAAGAGTGIAMGCVRLSQDALWSCVPAGTLIVIYNDADLNASVPAQDLALTDGNCVLVIPISNCVLLEKHTTLPSVGSATYPTAGIVPCGNWTNISMANTDDSFQTIDALGNPVFSVSWGNNILANIIYFAPTQAGKVCSNINASNTNPNNQANWVSTVVAGNETPGAPNSAANAAWINSMNNSCGLILPLTLTFSTLPTACGCTGSATVTASGGVGPYTYTWSPSAITTDTIGSLCVGNYTASVSSANGCLVNDTVSIISSVIITGVITTTNVSCNGAADGTATVVPSGSPGPFTYTWSPSGGNAATASNLPPGNYTVNITDAGGCTTTATTSITEPPVLTSTITSTNVTCFGANNGTATVTASGGTGAYTYTWSPTGGNTANATGLSPGNYTLTVTDVNGCATSASTLISEPTLISLTVTSTSVTCGGANGTASVSATGGTGPYTYTWSPVGGNAASANGLSGGNYSVNVSDANGCLATATVTIAQPVVITTTITSTNALCFGTNGSATVTASGGTGAYTYSWTPAGGTGATANFPMGNYTVTVTDANLCIATASVSITQPVVLTVTITPTNVNCFGANNGSIISNTSGGTGAYTYTWSPTGGNASSATNLSPGNYTVTVTDANSCNISASTLISEPTQVTLTVTTNPVACNGGSNGTATVSASGGTGAYTYTWSPIGGNASTTSNLPQGNYTVSIKDANGCFATSTFTITQPNAITVTVTSTNANCAQSNGSATVTASGGTGAYTYTWSPVGGNASTANNLGAGNYTVAVHDINNCAATGTVTILQPPSFTLSVTSTSVSCNGGTNGSATVNINGGTGPFNYNWLPAGGTNAATGNILSVGNYTVTVTDAGGCAGTATVAITQPAPVTVSASGQTVCKGQNATLTASASGGTAPYTYTWNTGASGSSISVATNVNATYTVVVTDNKGCVSAPDTAMVNVLSPLNVIVISNDTVCPGMPATLSAAASGGNGNYTITWLPSNTIGNSINVSPNTTTTYTAVVTDGCTVLSASATGVVTVLPVPVISFNANPASGCATICVTFAGVATSVPGNNISAYNWNFGDGTTGTGLNATHCYSINGSYNVTLYGTTQLGCKDSTRKNNLITVFPKPVADFNASAYQVDEYDNVIQFYDASQNNIVTWAWAFGTGATSGAQNPSYGFSPPGTYPVTLIVTNNFGCMDTVVKTITIKPAFTFYAPNAFTPNGDLSNEIFLPQGTGWDLTSYNLWVFDRWGNQLFHSTNANLGWDGIKNGEALMQDTYVWKVELNDILGAPHQYSGVVSIVK